MAKFARIVKAFWWAIKIAPHVDRVVVYQVPNAVSKSPSRIFNVSEQYFGYYGPEDYMGDDGV